MRHPCFQKPDSILEKLRSFHHEHATPVSCLMEDLHVAVTQLPYNTRQHEARVVAALLEKQTARHRDGVAIAELLPAVLARLGVNMMEQRGDRS